MAEVLHQNLEEIEKSDILERDLDWNRKAIYPAFSTSGREY